MDYNGGDELWRLQWGLIQSPKKVFFKSFQDESEGEQWGLNNNNTVISVNVKLNLHIEISQDLLNRYIETISNQFTNTLETATNKQITGVITFNNDTVSKQLIPLVSFYGNTDSTNAIVAFQINETASTE